MANFANPQEDINVLRMVLASGTAALPSVVFANDPTKGLSWTPSGLRLSGLADPINDDDAANKAYVDAAATGVLSIHADASPNLIGDVQFVSGTNITLTQVGQAITIDASGGGVSYPLLAPAGTDTDPSYSFAGNTSYGIYFDTNIVVVSSSSGLVLAGGYLQMGQPDSSDGFSLLSTGSSPLTLTDNTAGHDVLQLDGDATAGNTSMLLWDVDSGSLQRVSVGAADSGGTGFKVLRIPN